MSFDFAFECEILRLSQCRWAAASRAMIQRDQRPLATPLFSIIIPVFNDWVLLEECLESLTRQTNAPSFEIIIVDDGSSDPAPDFVHRSSQDQTVTLIRQSHAGVSADRNLGIRVARARSCCLWTRTASSRQAASRRWAQPSRVSRSKIAFNSAWLEIARAWSAEPRN